jgi:hypothetical protein
MRLTICLVALFAVAAVPVAQARTLYCKQESGNDATIGLADWAELNCGTYSATFEGVGVGLRYSGVSRVMITCPGQDDPRGVFHGTKFDVAFVVGLGTAAYVSAQVFCFVGSASYNSIGWANVSGSTLTIR